MNHPYDLTITICSWNTVADTRICLQSLSDCQSECTLEVIVVDNGSTDGSAAMIHTEFPWVTLIESPTNLGFCGGHNLALKKRNGKFALLLNSDTIVHPGALSELMEYGQEHPDVGIVGPKLLNPDGSLQYSCRKFPNPMAALFRSTILGRLFPNNRYTKDYLMTEMPHDQATEVDWVSGAALLVSDSALDVLEGLDPNFFMYCEDVDLCFRAWKGGFKVVYYPKSVITHAIGRSSDKAFAKMMLRFHRSMFYFYRKNIASEKPAIVRPVLLCLSAIALVARCGLLLASHYVRKAVRR